MTIALYVVCTIAHSLANTCSNSTHDGEGGTNLSQHYELGTRRMHMADGMTVVGGRWG